MIQTETSKAKILFKGLTANASRFKVFNDERPYLSYFLGVDTLREYLPQGNWTILNVLDDVTEDESEIICLSETDLPILATSLGVEGKTIILYELK